MIHLSIIHGLNQIEIDKNKEKGERERSIIQGSASSYKIVQVITNNSSFDCTQNLELRKQWVCPSIEKCSTIGERYDDFQFKYKDSITRFPLPDWLDVFLNSQPTATHKEIFKTPNAKFLIMTRDRERANKKKYLVDYEMS